MKRILITGAGSYIGTSFDRYLKEKYPGQYEVDTVDMVDGSWRKKSFSGYDSVFHVAGIAHRKETEKNAELYYKVNRDLAADCAAKAKNDGVKQFVFLSSMRAEQRLYRFRYSSEPENELRKIQIAGGNRVEEIGSGGFRSRCSQTSDDLRQGVQGKL